MFSEISISLMPKVGWTAMMLACREGHDRVVKTLLKAQANADAQSEVSCMLNIYIYSVLHYSFVSLRMVKPNNEL